MEAQAILLCSAHSGGIRSPARAECPRLAMYLKRPVCTREQTCFCSFSLPVSVEAGKTIRNELGRRNYVMAKARRVDLVKIHLVEKVISPAENLKRN